MSSLLNIFSNREFALILWVLIAIVFLLILRGGIKPIITISKIFFSKKLLIVHISLTIFLIPIIMLTKALGLWDLKDFIFWFIGVALILLFSAASKKDTIYFKNILLDGIKLTAMIEFVT